MRRKIVIGYGNPDRQDDGAGWYVISQLSSRLGRACPADGVFLYDQLGSNPDLFVTLQLTPELVDLLADYEQVCFVDSRVASLPANLEIDRVVPLRDIHPLSHHVTPQGLLDVYRRSQTRPLQAWLLTLPGFSFQFSRELSDGAKAECDKAVDWIWEWVHSG